MQELGRLLRCCEGNARCVSQKVLVRCYDILQAAGTSNSLRPITMEPVLILLKGTASRIRSSQRCQVP